MKTSARKKDLSTYEAFKASAGDWLEPIMRDYHKLAALAERAHAVLTFDLGLVNTDYLKEYGRVLLTSANGRVKEPESFLRKVYKACKNASSTDGFTQAVLKRQAI